MFDPEIYYSIVCVMAVLAVIVFFALQKITAGYGMMYTEKWGPTVNNRLGWILMEAPVFFAMVALWVLSPRRGEVAPAVMAAMFLVHYFQRSFIFPFSLKGKSRMPLAIIIMGVVFNLLNAYMLGGWLFYVSPADYYPESWLYSPLFLLGSVVFLFGMWINISSDRIIRNLRRPGDTGHYIPYGGMYRYVACGNYFGEFVEWTGYAILTWSIPGAVFALWTFCNLAPRARSVHKRYIKEFGDAYSSLNRRYIIPFIY